MALPLLIQVALTFSLLVLGFFQRARAVRRREMSIGFFRLLEGEAPQYIRQANRHFSNQFEMPVLFYTVAVLILALPVTSPLVPWLAWLWIISRLAHTGIHLTYNNVLHRATAFQIANIALAGLWIVAGAALLANG